MKKILIILALCLGLSAQAQMNYARTNTQEIVSSLPSILTNANGSITYNPTTNMLVSAGWCWITYIQPPTNGWVVISYLVTSTNQTLGTCSLWVKSQYNISQAADAMITNSPLWTSSFIANCKVFRTTLRSFGTTETNAVVNSDTMSTWLSAYALTNTITPQLMSQFLFMGQMYPQLMQFSTNTASFPWRFIP